MVNKTSATSYPFTTFESPVKTAKTAQKESLQDALHYEGSSNQQKTLMSPARNLPLRADAFTASLTAASHGSGSISDINNYFISILLKLFE